MTVPVVRLQVPAGDAFVAALGDAAYKYAARRNFTADTAETFVRLAGQAVGAVFSTGPSAIELTVTETAERIETLVTGIDARGPMASDARARLNAESTTCADLAIAEDPVAVSFALSLD